MGAPFPDTAALLPPKADMPKQERSAQLELGPLSALGIPAPLATPVAVRVTAPLAAPVAVRVTALMEERMALLGLVAHKNPVTLLAESLAVGLELPLATMAPQPLRGPASR